MILSSMATVALLVFAQLCPAKWKPRTGLGWPIDHFLAYFVVTSIVCLTWPRPFVVGNSLHGGLGVARVAAAFHTRS